MFSNIYYLKSFLTLALNIQYVRLAQFSFIYNSFSFRIGIKEIAKEILAIDLCILTKLNSNNLDRLRFTIQNSE